MFYANCFIFVSGFIHMVRSIQDARAKKLGDVCRALGGCGMMVPFWIGMIMRVMHTSRVCSGDFLEDEDKTDGYVMYQGNIFGFVLMLLTAVMCMACVGGFIKGVMKAAS